MSLNRKKLFEVAILLHEELDDSSVKSEILRQPYVVLAENEREVTLRAAREIPEQYMDNLEDVEVVVRPF